ncbi:MAG: hypothetical protein A2418_01690 [Candidatus Brennerbacteria bacterium RIFOXYC1_FULL_41_11]|uniref:Uncharacterized protein n=1 Tax=Candidatus Brennerbacteria bacterium RIFOXYD1_FULL_41_16 TaxID=1797529 RepID=A0A1G1XJK7_9BACT|nr:MAG: hypothetical protein UU61_C0015G0009 [Parcubacteria group bacterium GW2011_GWB1_41_4]OGY38890.1 MAG: hypothetical protein A2391_03195 [Candidatus Brennerbacteria bacterium RIFOXYB1_FULL_41_13]OGY38951.1 MAG: hypothetical protein A2418_01690 [Candidatus Brennerbacteria bacterium RIFOXYC1_FULL_41_11]OGY40064.1 MAG: hypothetical protein A2570_01515 [Candidatus Brennerbacteria bacterium RIFOXYD1_FULL_41_16]
MDSQDIEEFELWIEGDLGVRVGQRRIRVVEIEEVGGILKVYVCSYEKEDERRISQCVEAALREYGPRFWGQSVPRIEITVESDGEREQHKIDRVFILVGAVALFVVLCCSFAFTLISSIF